MTLDLHRHAVLEASAGTGKTHSIGELVLRLIKEEAVPLDQILIVTFTEKATGELKSRLRSAIEQELDNSPPHRPVLQAALDNFDQAWIFTLHGFCRRILQEYPIEQGQDLRSELVDDAELLEPCLRELQRRTWRQEYGDFLDEVLEISGYNRQTARAWEERVLELARRLRPECGEQVVPAMIEDWPLKLAGLRARLQKRLPQIKEMLPRVVWNRRLKCLQAWVENEETYAMPLRAFHQLYRDTEGKNGFAETGFPCLLPDEMALFSPGENGAHADAATAMVSFLEKVHKAGEWRQYRYQLAVRTVHQLQRALADFKRRHGQWSFQDMIARVEEGLDPAKNPRALELAGKLRERFRYGIVDEFQDTDPLQWRILRRIFLDDGPRSSALAEGERLNGASLILVGDPKQAIFGFRGADLPTYLAATMEMLDRHQAQEHPLLVNWRSTPEMLKALNRLFAGQNWFPAMSGIAYRAVTTPPEVDRPNKIVADRTGRAAVNVVDWTRDEPLVKLRRQNAQWIVREIERLLAGAEDGPTVVSIRKAPPRPLCAGDICILVFRRSEAKPLLAALSDAGIPYSFYKQPALWQSDEAKELRIILEALSQPEHEATFRKALLTRFFRIKAADLAAHEDLPTQHPARQLFENWLDLAARRQWTALFQSLLEDTGLLFDDVFAGDADRFRANYRHLVGQLVQQAYAQNLDLLGLVELCGQLDGRSDENLQPKETEEPRVQITTIHASKGLEFPIVFLAGGWTEGVMDKLLSYRDKDGMVYDLSDPAGDAARQAAACDKLDERRRLLYVALTRAMFKLYVPLVREDSPKFKAQGPLVKLLAPALNRARLDQMDSACAAYLEPSLRSKPLLIYRGPDGKAASDRGTGFLARPSTSLSRDSDAESEGSRVDELEGPSHASPSDGWHIDGPLFPSLDADLSRPGIVIRSFTSLHRAAAVRAGEGSSFATEVPRVEDEDIDVAAATVEVQKDPLRGAVFGEIVHGVLEKIDFAAVAQTVSPPALLRENSATAKAIAEEVDFYLPSLPVRLPEEELRSLCRQRVADLVWRALRTPLAELGGPLCQVPQKDRLHELQFHFPEDEAPSVPASVRREEGFVTGFIDLVVRRHQRYFLVDWKTNVLPSYGPEDVSRAMAECDYHLQYRLYLQALSRWLRRSLGPTFDEARDLGGVYYLFLRGMTGQAGNEGVFYHHVRAE